MDLICDTNIWYDIGSGDIDANAVKAQGHRLLATAVNALEIGSKLSDKSLVYRKRAAKAILDHADAILDDPERHLGILWQTPIPPLKLDWRDLVKAVAEAPDMSGFTNGIIDVVEQVVRRVDHALATSWRTQVYADFEKDIITVIDGEIPGYAAARAQKKGATMKQAQLNQFQAKMADPGMFAAAVLATYDRVRLQVPNSAAQPAQALKPDAFRKLYNYGRAYPAYLVHIAAGHAPEPNDWGDLEAFIYLHDGMKLLTSETKWHEVAQRGGIAGEVVHPNAFLIGGQSTKSVHDQRQEWAYFNWRSRGKPSGDDWTDWFGAVGTLPT